MDAKRVITVDEKIKVIKLKVKNGTMIYDGRILLIYEPVLDNNAGDDGKQAQKKLFKSTEAGIIRKILIKEGDVISAGSEIVELEKECNHPTVIKDLCAECGADLQKENKKDGVSPSQASVSMVHMVPELKVNDELAQILGKADMDRLLECKKLVLLVDLDQTLIHTTNDDIPNNIKDVYHFQLYGSKSPWYHTRLRPGTHNFLQGISEKYELHICTFGSRRYAHTIARFLDADGKIFSHRILSRDECFDANSKTANLKALFPCGENMVCIIDDREDVWDYASNLIHVKPYHFFQHTGDIHAPPGLTKCENDDNKDGFDFTQLNTGSSDTTAEDSIIQYHDSVEDSVQNENDNVVVNEEQERTVEDGDSIDPLKNVEESAPLKNVEESAEKNKNEETDQKNSDQPEKPSNSDSEKFVEKMECTEGELPKENVNQADENKCNTDDSPTVPTNEDNEKNEDKDNLTMSHTNSDDTQPELKSVGEQPGIRPAVFSKVDENGFIIIEEADDYLLYLEEILKIIHAEFFSRYQKTGEIPDLKQVIPERRATVLRDVKIVFSGIVPNRMKLEDSPAYKIARSLGAIVTQNIEPDTTHLVAIRAGTAKVHAASKRRNLKLVTPEWLWTCAERWEKVDERLFTLRNAKFNTESRHPPAHCRSPDHIEPPLPFISQNNKTFPLPQNSGFLLSINPFMSLSSEDIESMEGEVEDIFKESDDEIETDKETQELSNSRLDESQDENSLVFGKKRKLEDSLSNSNPSSSEEGEAEDFEFTTKTKKKRRRRIESKKYLSTYVSNEKIEENNEEAEDDEDDDEDEEDSDDETIAAKFRRGESLPSDLDIDYNTEEGTEEDQESDGEWNVMGAALEREFLEGD